MASRRERSPVLLFFWDYDTQWGADSSRSPGGCKTWGHLEFENTERLLELHAEHDVAACFAVVGAAALPGERPYHDPAQIRRIHAAGHEVASHSLRHEWLPGLTPLELRRTLRTSKDALEQCIGAEVTSFVPPFNQPFDYPPGWSFSLSERQTAGEHRTDLTRLCAMLVETGYSFARVAYRGLLQRVAEKIIGRELHRPSRLERISGLACLRLNVPVGFGASSRKLLADHLDDDGIWLLWGHPHSVTASDSPQSLELFEGLLRQVAEWRAAGRLRITRPRDLLAEGVRVA
jgi:hypothetical protein